MENNQTLSIRELQFSDIEHIANYWLDSDPDYLIGMGVDLDKVPPREGLTNFLTSQIEAPIEQKDSYALIWEIDDSPVGHCNVNQIEFGKQANMHLHFWNSEHRKKGMGTELVKLSIPVFFQKLKLKTLYCEPNAHNPAPNKTLEKIGFEFEKEYVTVPGSLNFEQAVKRWRLGPV